MFHQYTYFMDRTANFYSRPSYEFHGGGGGFNVFVGSRRQRGGTIFGSLKGAFMPIAKNLGKVALASGVALAQDIIRDKLKGRSLKDSIMEHGKSRVLDFAKTAASTAAKEGLLRNLVGMVGKGKGKKRRKRMKTKTKTTKSKSKSKSNSNSNSKSKSKKQKRKKPSKSVSRKRSASSSTSHRRKAKKRRTTSNF